MRWWSSHLIRSPYLNFIWNEWRFHFLLDYTIHSLTQVVEEVPSVTSTLPITPGSHVPQGSGYKHVNCLFTLTCALPFFYIILISFQTYKKLQEILHDFQSHSTITIVCFFTSLYICVYVCISCKNKPRHHAPLLLSTSWHYFLVTKILSFITSVHLSKSGF